jgi:hypothetical protein
LEITGSGIRLKARLVQRQIKTYQPQKRRPAGLRNRSDLTPVISLVFGVQLSVNYERATQAYKDRRGRESNPRIAVLQTATLPLGYPAIWEK